MKCLTFIALLGLTACATTPRVDSHIENRDAVSNGVEIGVKDHELVAQKEVFMSEELRKLQNDVYTLEAKVYGGDRYLDNNGLYGALRSCYLRQAQATKEITVMPEKRSYVVPDEEYEMGLGRDERIVGLKRETLAGRMGRYRNYKSILLDRADEYQGKIDRCDLMVGGI